ncbi:MAG: DUF3297 family protein [Burkholderiales bacterium]|jgi:hypothetical protein|nr:DUF3297 family protein [Nitrosomonadaceae bacterium]
MTVSTTPDAADAAATDSKELALPDRLAVDPRSPFHNAAVLDRAIGIRFNGKDRNDVDEYCVSEGWVKVAVGNKVDRRGNPLTIRLKGTVEPYFR